MPYIYIYLLNRKLNIKNNNTDLNPERKSRKFFKMDFVAFRSFLIFKMHE